MAQQLEFDWTGLTLADLQAMLRAGLICCAGMTEDSRVRSYALTPAGRALLENRLAAWNNQPMHA